MADARAARSWADCRPEPTISSSIGESQNDMGVFKFTLHMVQTWLQWKYGHIYIYTYNININI